MDPSDLIFKEGWSGYLGSNNPGVDLDILNNATRSPMVMLLNGISNTDSYRVEVIYTVEFIPCITFAAWAEQSHSPLTSDVTRQLSKTVMNYIGDIVSGFVGRELAGSQAVG